jgi:hypothetical protein
MKPSLPKELEPIRDAARRELGLLKPADERTSAPEHFLFNAKRSDAGRSLPPYYLVYFLLVDLLGFKNLGQFEKVAWSVPVDLDGRAYLIEHRKFGLGVFVEKLPEDEVPAAEIVRLVAKGVKAAEPYFQWRADQAAAASELNVHNRSRELYSQFRFFADAAEAKSKEAETRKEEQVRTPMGGGYTIRLPSLELMRDARWLRLAAVEHFYSWTEHIFIHLAILMGGAVTGDDVAVFAKAEWAEKYKAAIGLGEAVSKRYYDDLLALRRQVRNFVAHGSFGKDGEALSFHSTAGAVPMLLREKGSKSHLTFGIGLDFNDKAAMVLIERFVSHLWSGQRAPAKIYIQESGLPLILTYARDGTYGRALQSEEEMESFVEALGNEFDRSANMDF